MTVMVPRLSEAKAREHCSAWVEVCRADSRSEGCKSGARELDRDRGESGASSLYDASYRGQGLLVANLLAAGFDPNAKLSGPDWPGWTPLMIAAAEGHESVVRHLLEAGADPNARSKLGRTSLMFASAYGYSAIAELLLDEGAAPNVVPNDDAGWTRSWPLRPAGGLTSSLSCLHTARTSHSRTRTGRRRSLWRERAVTHTPSAC